MKLAEKIAEMKADAEKMCAAIYEVRPRADARHPAKHLVKELIRLQNFVNGREPDPTQGTVGQQPEPGLADLDV